MEVVTIHSREKEREREMVKFLLDERRTIVIN